MPGLAAAPLSQLAVSGNQKVHAGFPILSPYPNGRASDTNEPTAAPSLENPQESIHILERLAASPGATPRVRQNLALAYGLAGDMKMAKKIGRIDLSDEMVTNNISYFEAIQDTQEYAGLIPKNNTIPLDQTRKWQETH